MWRRFVGPTRAPMSKTDIQYTMAPCVPLGAFLCLSLSLSRCVPGRAASCVWTDGATMNFILRYLNFLLLSFFLSRFRHVPIGSPYIYFLPWLFNRPCERAAHSILMCDLWLWAKPEIKIQPGPYAQEFFFFFFFRSLHLGDDRATAGAYAAVNLNEMCETRSFDKRSRPPRWPPARPSPTHWHHTGTTSAPFLFFFFFFYFPDGLSASSRWMNLVLPKRAGPNPHISSISPFFNDRLFSLFLCWIKAEAKLPNSAERSVVVVVLLSLWIIDALAYFLKFEEQLVERHNSPKAIHTYCCK